MTERIPSTEVTTMDRNPYKELSEIAPGPWTHIEYEIDDLEIKISKYIDQDYPVVDVILSSASGLGEDDVQKRWAEYRIYEGNLFYSYTTKNLIPEIQTDISNVTQISGPEGTKFQAIVVDFVKSKIQPQINPKS